jgi:L-fuculose-phosphate aldolase
MSVDGGDAGLLVQRELIASTARRLAEQGLALGTAGNLSVRVGDLVAITGSGACLAKLTADDVSVIDLDGSHLSGQRGPSSEIAMHLGVYRSFDAGAVIHTHPPVASSLAALIDEIPVVHYQMMWLGGSIRVAPYATFGTEILADLVLEALEGRTAALLAHHGAVTFGRDLETAVERTLLLEWACGVYWRAATLGTPRTLTEADQQAVLDAAQLRGHLPAASRS